MSSTGDLVAVLRYQGPRAIGMPELHKLTPALGVLQDRGHQVALVTDGRMSGASGKVPAAIHLTPEAAIGGPLARVRDGDTITVDADAGTLTVHVRDDEFAARTPTGRAPTATRWSAPDANCSPACAPPSDPPTRAPASSPPTSHDTSVSKQIDPTHCSTVSPSFPSSWSTTSTHAVPIARALVAGGLPVIELTLRTPVRARRHRTDRGRSTRDLPRRGHHRRPGQAEAGRVGGRPVPGVARQHADLRTAMPDTGLPHLPGVATVSEILTALEAGYTELKFFPAEAAGGANYLKSVHSPIPAARFCPTGGITAANAPTSTWRCRTSDASEDPGSPHPRP